jgi:hypothetical protein
VALSCPVPGDTLSLVIFILVIIIIIIILLLLLLLLSSLLLFEYTFPPETRAYLRSILPCVFLLQWESLYLKTSLLSSSEQKWIKYPNSLKVLSCLEIEAEPIYSLIRIIFVFFYSK